MENFVPDALYSNFDTIYIAAKSTAVMPECETSTNAAGT